MLLKTVIGYVLLRTAWRYHNRASKDKKHEEDTPDASFSASRNVRDPTLHKRHSTSINETDGAGRKRKSKSLSDIERFTLCSNRII